MKPFYFAFFLLAALDVLFGFKLNGGPFSIQNKFPFDPTNSPFIFDLNADEAGTLSFFGTDSADLFSKEIKRSFSGVLSCDFVSKANTGYPLGFLNASPVGQPWYGTMWTRDAGTFMRELIFWGYFRHACQVAECVMDGVGTNNEGFFSFPRYLDPKQGTLSGSEMDGQAATIISMVALWQRLPPDYPFRAWIRQFLIQPSSPVCEIHNFLLHGPLVPGSGEFGGGMHQDDYNVVQNNLCALALISAARMEDAMGDFATAKQWQNDALTLFQNISKYLVNGKGTWIWGIDIRTLKPNHTDSDSARFGGSGGLNGVTSMSADVFGFDPTIWPWQGALVNGLKTFQELYAFPIRKRQFDQYGFWAQMNYTHKGLLTSPSYGQGYALQDMLLFDNLAMAGRGLDYLSEATYRSPGVVFSYNNLKYGRLSPYYFYERMYSPDAKGQILTTAGCGPLNLVNVSEPLKVARLIAGVDDTSMNEVRIIPRLPKSWTGFRMGRWPILTSRGVVRADIDFEKKNGREIFTLHVRNSGEIPKLAVRFLESGNEVWKRQDDARVVRWADGN